MRKNISMMQILQTLVQRWGLIAGLLVGLGACASRAEQTASIPIGPTRAWTEQVQLHDGSVITAKRTYTLGGRSEPGARESASTFQTILFNAPAGDIEWTTDFRDSQPEPNSLSLIAFDIVKGVPFIATRPAGCIAYNKWQRPNPPQVLFKYINKQWVRIGLDEFPQEITKANVVLGRPSTEVLKPFYTVADVQKENMYVTQPEYRSILREPMANGGSGCSELLSNGKGSWVGMGWFRDQPSLNACLSYCTSENFDQQTCPCKRIFEGK